MPSKPPFYDQETPDSCVPACLRMVLGSFGVEIAESELREQCDCTPYYGTGALMTVHAARQLGFARTAKHTVTLGELRTLVTDGHHPIVFVDLGPIDGTEDIHALVVVDLSQHEIIVLDPLKNGHSRCNPSTKPGPCATTLPSSSSVKPSFTASSPPSSSAPA